MRARHIQLLLVAPTRARRREAALQVFLQERAFRCRTLRDIRRAAGAVERGQAQTVLFLQGGRSPTPLAAVLGPLRDANPDVPVVVLAPRPTVEEAAEAVAGRAHAYIPADEFGPVLDGCLQRILEEKGYLRTPEERILGVLGARLREARLAQRLTLRQVAHRTGLSVSLISQVERARNSPSLSTLLQISRALRLKVADLFQGY